MRRAVLVLAVIACTASVSQAQNGAPTDGGGYEVLANAFGFGIDIPGCADASKNIREISIDELNIDIREMTTGLDVEYRTYSPGAAHYGQARLTVAVSPNDTCLAEWFEAAKAGKNIRKNLTVRLFKSDKTPGRSYSLFDTFPVSFTETRSDDPVGQAMVLTVQVDRVGFDGGIGKSPQNPAPMNGFIVQALGGKDPTPVVDAAWESCTGGALALETHPASFGADADAKRSHTEVTLRGPMTTSRGWLGRWLNEVARGVDSRVMLRCGLTKGGRGYTYMDAFPVRYVFPRMSVTNTTGNVMEEVALKPIRVELK